MITVSDSDSVTHNKGVMQSKVCIALIDLNIDTLPSCTLNIGIG